MLSINFHRLLFKIRNSFNYDILKMSTIFNSYDGREWHIIVPKSSTNKNFRFSIASYNVLSQSLLEDNLHLYEKSDRSHLQWDCRKWKLLQEFSHYDADIFSLQELEAEHYHDFFKHKFKESGYESVFKKRTGDKPDGCAIFYRTSKFVCVFEKKINYKNINCNVLDRDNVAILLLLKPVFSTKPNIKRQDDFICVTNTHIVFNENRGDVKLAQIMTLLASINEFCPKHVPVIMCGDFNLHPFSDLYNFIVGGQIVCSQCNLKTMSGQQMYESKFKTLADDFLGRRSGLTMNCHFANTYSDNQQNKKKRKNSLVNMEDSIANGQPLNMLDTLTYNDEYPCISKPSSVMFKYSTAASKDTRVYQNFSDSSRNNLKNIETIKFCPDLETASCDPSSEIVPNDLKTLLPRSVPELMPRDFSPEIMPHDPMPKIGSRITRSGTTSNDTKLEIISHKQASEIGGSRNAMSGIDSRDPSSEMVLYEPAPGMVCHDFKFLSTYEHWKKSRNNVEVTTNHRRAECTVDYIFYEPRSNQESGVDRLTLTRRLNLFTLDYFMRYPASLPDELHASDHYILLAEFSYQP